MDKSKLEALLEEAMVDCYNEEECFWGMFYTLEDHLTFPLQAQTLREAVTVVGLDDHRSRMRRGVMARVRKGDQKYTAALF